MSPALEQFLSQRLPFTGLVAWSARLPDRTQASQSYAPWLPDARADQILTRLALAAEDFKSQQLGAVRLCWVFEQLSLHLAAGSQGMFLALIVQNVPELSRDLVDATLEDFRKL